MLEGAEHFLSYKPCLAGVSKLESLMPTAFNQCWFAHGLDEVSKCEKALRHLCVTPVFVGTMVQRPQRAQTSPLLYGLQGPLTLPETANCQGGASSGAVLDPPSNPLPRNCIDPFDSALSGGTVPCAPQLKDLQFRPYPLPSQKLCDSRRVPKMPCLVWVFVFFSFFSVFGVDFGVFQLPVSFLYAVPWLTGSRTESRTYLNLIPLWDFGFQLILHVHVHAAGYPPSLEPTLPLCSITSLHYLLHFVFRFFVQFVLQTFLM